MSTTNKHRYWWFVLYPESSVKDWRYKITMRGLPFAISPLHEYDVDSEGELKKPHHHVLLCYTSGGTTFNNVKSLSVDELGATIPKPVDNVRGAYEYLIHKNHPDKFQYSEEDIECCNGFDIFEMVQLSEKDKAEINVSIINDIKVNDIDEYYKLVDFYISNEDYQKFNIVSTHTIFFNRYIASRRHCSAESDAQYVKKCTDVSELDGGD